ncbi:DICT domain protein [Halalkaliarchaeum desulfuricum]|uniref:DICT domain protein n=1 Tax=Halalkaliarchaeum desulfuricum TaxID=2055893 RepID=A0A343TGD0_9EURY|nr:DICT sensory domain-containing protein [Halalkaliarchaeum desulfuricum]AUX08152.1 DICT domain protein [Halalkaliarchaeum desulfuricum]
MSLTELIAGVESYEKTLTVINTDGDVVADLRDRFSDRNLEIETATMDGGPESFGVLGQAGTFLTAIDLEELADPGTQRDPEFVAGTYRPILDHLDQTMFTSYSAGEMLAASREIEDRAWRVGAGELHAGFQTLEVFSGELPTYERLAGKQGLSVHAYAVPEGTLPNMKNVTLHVERDSEIRKTWFVAYDGAGVDESKCALLAEEREDGHYYGFWSYDPSTVDYMIDHLTSTYGFAESDEHGGTTPY